MFSALSRVMDLMLGSGNHGSIPVIKHKPVEPATLAGIETKQFFGRVTSIHEGYGLIDGEVYFKNAVVDGNKKPQVGDMVHVTASRQHQYGGWTAAIVAPLSESEMLRLECSNEQWGDDDAVASQISPQEHAGGETTECQEDALIAVVTSIHSNGGYLNDFIRFSIDDIQGGYLPYRGDWVTAKAVTDLGTGAQMAVGIKPLRQQDFEGSVVSVNQGFGFIEGDIYFTFEVCAEDYVPHRHDQVCGTAVETSQGKNEWRAVRVEPKEDVPDILQSASMLSSPMQKQWSQELFSDKQGITITGNNILHLKLGQVKVNTFHIRNTSKEDCCFKGCQLKSGTESQFKISSISHGNDGTESQLDSAEPRLLGPQQMCKVAVTCSSKHPGWETQLLLFEFSGFKIGRQISVQVVDPIQEDVGPVTPYQRKRHQAQGLLQGATRGGSGTWVVPGQRPQIGRVMKHLPTKLSQYPVPGDLRACVQDRGDVVALAPSLGQELDVHNYSSRFSVLLHLEEIEQEIEMSTFDMQHVSLHVHGEYLALNVPGLAEGRPSLLIGDRVVLSLPAMCGEAPDYEGFIHKVLCEDILLKFHAELHDSYKGEAYHVRFGFNRANFRRCHHAVTFVAAMGDQVLFPKSFLPKIPQTQLGNSATAQRQGTPIVKAQFMVGVRKCPLGAKTSNKVKRHKFFNSLLNARQRAAVTRILSGQCRPVPYILFGPPGTGKTLTLVEAILQTHVHIAHSRIVACTPSNSAADLLAERLHNSGLLRQSDMVRLNAYWRQEQNIPECLLPYCSDGDNLEVVARHRVIVCTCSMAGMLYALGLKTGHFTHVFIDEAGQATEPECMVPIGLINGADGQIVLAGDPQQLGPVLRSNLSKTYGLQVSYLERLINRPLYARDETKFLDHGSYDPLLVTKLVENYRSHPVLLQLPSDLFYHGELEVSADKELIESLCDWDMLPSRSNCPLIFHGIRGEDLREGDSPSWFNPVEAVQVMKYLNALVHNTVHHVTFDDIGIITPYRKQVEKIRLLIDRLGMQKVKVGSVEEFQGQERLVMIISTVRSRDDLVGLDRQHNLGFLSNPKRFNVCITRAQALLIVVGNPHLLAQDQNWLALLKYAIMHNAYTGCDLPVGLAAVSEDLLENMAASSAADRDAWQQCTSSESVPQSLESETMSGMGSHMAGRTELHQLEKHREVSAGVLKHLSVDDDSVASPVVGEDGLNASEVGKDLVAAGQNPAESPSNECRAEKVSGLVAELPESPYSKLETAEDTSGTEKNIVTVEEKEAADHTSCTRRNEVTADDKETAHYGESDEQELSCIVRESEAEEIGRMDEEATGDGELERETSGRREPVGELVQSLEETGGAQETEHMWENNGAHNALKDSEITDMPEQVGPEVVGAVDLFTSQTSSSSVEDKVVESCEQPRRISLQGRELASDAGHFVSVDDEVVNGNGRVGISAETPGNSDSICMLTSQKQDLMDTSNFASAFGAGATSGSDLESGDTALESIKDFDADFAEELDRLNANSEKKVEKLDLEGVDHLENPQCTAVGLNCDALMQEQIYPTVEATVTGAAWQLQPGGLQLQAPARLAGLEAETKASGPEIWTPEQRIGRLKPQIQAQMLVPKLTGSSDAAADKNENSEKQREEQEGESSSAWEKASQCMVEASDSTMASIQIQKPGLLESSNPDPMHKLTASLETQPCHQEENAPSKVCALSMADPGPDQAQSPVLHDTRSGSLVSQKHVSVEHQDDALSPELGGSQTTDLQWKIIRQIEYYFGDFNLMRDVFLQSQIQNDPEGWCPLKLLVTFNRMKSLSTDFNVIVNALKKSTSGLVEVSRDGLSVRTTRGRPWLKDKQEWKQSMKERAVAVEGISKARQLDQIQQLFQKFGDVEHLELGIPMLKTCQGRRSITYIDLIIFFKRESLELLRRNTKAKFWDRETLTYHFGFTIISEGIEYFFSKRIMGVKKSALKPIHSQHHHQTHRAYNSRNSRSRDTEAQLQGQASRVCEAQPDYHDGKSHFGQSRTRFPRPLEDCTQYSRTVMSPFGQSGVRSPKSFDSPGQGRMYQQFQNEDVDWSEIQKATWSPQRRQGEDYSECYSSRSLEGKRPAVPGHSSFEDENQFQDPLMNSMGFSQAAAAAVQTTKEARVPKTEQKLMNEPTVSSLQTLNEAGPELSSLGNAEFTREVQLKTCQPEPHLKRKTASMAETVAADILLDDNNFVEPAEPFQQATPLRVSHQPTVPVGAGPTAAVDAQLSNPKVVGRGRAKVYGMLMSHAKKVGASGSIFSSPTQPRGRGAGGCLPASALPLPRATSDASVPMKQPDSGLEPHRNLQPENPPFPSRSSTPVSNRIAANLGQNPVPSSPQSPGLVAGSPASPKSPQGRWELSFGPSRVCRGSSFSSPSNVQSLPGPAGVAPQMPDKEEQATSIAVQRPSSVLVRSLDHVPARENLGTAPDDFQRLLEQEEGDVVIESDSSSSETEMVENWT